MRILLASTPVGPLGSGIGGGVELTLHTMVLGLAGLGHHVEVVAPAGSLHVGHVVHQVEGALQPSSQHQRRDAPITMPPDPVLGAMWDVVRDRAPDVDVIVNLAYDWLPFHVGPALSAPVAHLVSMGSLNDAMDAVIARTLEAAPGTVAVHSRAQARTFAGLPIEAFRVIGNGIVVERYDLRVDADDPPYLGFVGRIAPEKGLDTVAEVSERTGLAVRVWGLVQDQAYLDGVLERHPGARFELQGFVPTDVLQAAIGGCTAIVMTPTWIEAFGNVAIEAMACGVPVIAWDAGGPAEIVTDGVTGFLVPDGDVDAVVSAVEHVDRLDRRACRARVEAEFSAAAHADRVLAWLEQVVADRSIASGISTPR